MMKRSKGASCEASLSVPPSASTPPPRTAATSACAASSKLTCNAAGPVLQAIVPRSERRKTTRPSTHQPGRAADNQSGGKTPHRCLKLSGRRCAGCGLILQSCQKIDPDSHLVQSISVQSFSIGTERTAAHPARPDLHQRKWRGRPRFFCCAPPRKAARPDAPPASSCGSTSGRSRFSAKKSISDCRQQCSQPS